MYNIFNTCPTKKKNYYCKTNNFIVHSKFENVKGFEALDYQATLVYVMYSFYT